jgi:hypothetical protein
VTTVLFAALLSLSASAQNAFNPSCVEALVAIGESRLTGIFAFVSEKDSAAAFADFLMRDKSALKKFVAKDEKDLKELQGLSQWDHDVISAALAFLASPLAETVEKPAAKVVARLNELARSPVLTLEQIAAARRKK